MAWAAERQCRNKRASGKSRSFTKRCGASRGQGSGIEVKEMTTAKTIFYKRQANAQPKTSKLRQPRQEPRSPRGQSRARRSEIGATDQQRAEGRPGRASSPVPAGAAFL